LRETERGFNNRKGNYAVGDKRGKRRMINGAIQGFEYLWRGRERGSCVWENKITTGI